MKWHLPVVFPTIDEVVTYQHVFKSLVAVAFQCTIDRHLYIFIYKTKQITIFIDGVYL